MVLLAVVAALVVVASGIGAFVVLSEDQPSEVASDASPDEVASDASPDEVPSEASPDATEGSPGRAILAWESPDVAAFGGPGDQVIRAMADRREDAGETRFVAMGVDGATGEQDAAAWVSPDGRAWTTIDDPDLVGPGNQGINGAAFAFGVIVAGGSDDAAGTNDAAVWLSADGVDWKRVADDSLGGAGDQRIIRVKNTAAGLLATGVDTAGGDADAAVWISTDEGRSWDRVPDPAGALGGVGDQRIERVVDADPIVAVGAEETPEGSDAAVWVSADGLSWQRVPDDAGVLGGPGDQQMNDASRAGDSILAVGSDASGEDREGAVWVSTDGLEWSRLGEAESVFGGAGDQTLTRIAVPEEPAPGEPGHVIVGVEAATDESDAAVWLSDDGETWTREAGVAAFGGPGEQVMLALRPAGFPVIAMGADASGDNRDGAVWIAGSPTS